jgi:hypothetical protein
MMAKDRDQRVASCAELIGELEKFLESRGASGNLVERVAASAGSRSPSPPTSTATAELDSQPTRQVSSDAFTRGGDAVTTPAAETEMPIVETSPLGEPPSDTSSGKRLALVAAVVVFFGLAAVVAAGIFAWKSGLFKAAVGGSTITTGVESESPSTTIETGLESAIETRGNAEQMTTAAGAAVPISAKTGSEPATKLRSAASGRVESEVTDQENAKRQIADSSAFQPEPRQEPASQPPPMRPPPEGTVVIAVGETILAGEAEAVIEKTLARAGIPLIDENGIPGIAAFLGTDLTPEPGEIHRLLRPYAEHLVFVRVEYLGERPLVYMGQQDVAFQARVIMVPIDLQAGNALAAPVRLRTEYTHLNAQRVAEKELRRPAYRIAQLLADR